MVQSKGIMYCSLCSTVSAGEIYSREEGEQLSECWGSPAMLPLNETQHQRCFKACDRLVSARNPGPMMGLSDFSPRPWQAMRSMLRPCNIRQLEVGGMAVNQSFKETLLTSRPSFPILPGRGDDGAAVQDPPLLLFYCPIARYTFKVSTYYQLYMGPTLPLDPINFGNSTISPSRGGLPEPRDELSLR